MLTIFFTILLGRYQFFLQLKTDIRSGRLECPLDTLIQLAACSLQCKIYLAILFSHLYTIFFVSVAELGDYDEAIHTPAFVSEFRFVPEQSEEMEISFIDEYKKYK